MWNRTFLKSSYQDPSENAIFIDFEQLFQKLWQYTLDSGYKFSYSPLNFGIKKSEDWQNLPPPTLK